MRETKLINRQSYPDCALMYHNTSLIKIIVFCKRCRLRLQTGGGGAAYYSAKWGTSSSSCQRENEQGTWRSWRGGGGKRSVGRET